MFSANICFRRKDFTLDVSISLKKGNITALLGASGSGKSTLFRLLSGLEKPQIGTIYSGETCWYDAENQTNLSIQKRKVGMVFQDNALFEHLTVFENIAFGVKPADQKRVVNHWLEKINLSHKAQSYPEKLSGGEKQRVALARTLAIEPELLLLDEPFSALDGFLRQELRRELQLVIKHTQIPVLVATHDLHEARLLTDMAYVMSEGKIIQSGDTRQLFKNPKTIEAAKVFGWQNILPVSYCEGVYICGAWGRLKLNKECRNITGIAIPVDAISIMPFDAENTHLSTKIAHIVLMDNYLLVETILNDGSLLVIHTKTDKQLSLGGKLNIVIDISQIATFNQ